MDPGQLMRDPRIFTLSSVDQQILGPNERRRAVLIGAPLASQNRQSHTVASAPAYDQTVVGTVVQTPVFSPPGKVLNASMFGTAGAFGTVEEQVVLGATVLVLARHTASFTSTLMPLEMDTGWRYRLQQTVAGALGTADAVIGYEQDIASIRATISFTGPAVIDEGITIYENSLPLLLLDEWVGRSIREEVHAVASSSPVKLCVVDIFLA